ncbi:MAG: energy transducer TonB [Acidobacteriaceae bacterium]
MPDPPRKPESSRAFETHADDAKPTGIRRYINILAIVVPILIALVLVLIIVHSLNEPASNPSPTASTEPSPAPSTPSPTPTADATPPATTPAPAPAPVATRPPTPSPKPGPATKSIPAAAPASADQIFTIPMEAAAAMRISGDSAVSPAIANAAGIHGTVVLEITISKTGTVDDVKIVSGPPLLQDAALAAVKTYRYQPFQMNGKPVRVRTLVGVIFMLRSGASSSTARSPST